jgi:hypothetical protein
MKFPLFCFLGPSTIKKSYFFGKKLNSESSYHPVEVGMSLGYFFNGE